MFKWLFKDKGAYRKEYSIEERKRNWLGLTKIYESRDPEYDWCTITVSSHESDEDEHFIDSGNVLTIGFGHTRKVWLLPFKIIQPVLDYHFYRKDDNGNDTEEIKWTMYAEKEYGFSYFKDMDTKCLHFKIAYVNNLLYNITKHKDKSKFIMLFWTYAIRSSHVLLNLDKSDFMEINDLSVGLESYSEYKKVIDTQPKLRVRVRDFDGIELIATLSASRSIYKYGGYNKKLRWLTTLFKKPIVSESLSMSFDKEIGKGKGSWKGGTMGTSTEFLNREETLLEAFTRYCTDHTVRGFRSTEAHNLTVIGLVDE